MHEYFIDINLKCEEDTKILLIPTKKYELILESSNKISNYVNNILSSRFSDTMWILEQVVFHSLDKRLANYLLEQEINNTLYVTHEKIANELGSAREVISRMLKYFEKDNIVLLSRNKISITNIQKLVEIAEK